MSGYAAVNAAYEMADRENTLLKEVAKRRAEKLAQALRMVDRDDVVASEKKIKEDCAL